MRRATPKSCRPMRISRRCSSCHQNMRAQQLLYQRHAAFTVARLQLTASPANTLSCQALLVAHPIVLSVPAPMMKRDTHHQHVSILKPVRSLLPQPACSDSFVRTRVHRQMPLFKKVPIVAEGNSDEQSVDAIESKVQPTSSAHPDACGSRDAASGCSVPPPAKHPRRTSPRVLLHTRCALLPHTPVMKCNTHYQHACSDSSVHTPSHRQMPLSKKAHVCAEGDAKQFSRCESVAGAADALSTLTKYGSAPVVATETQHHGSS